MTSNPEQSSDSIPLNHQDDLQTVREAANKALKNIQSLYNEIMTPKIFSDFEDEFNCDFSSNNSTSNTPVHKKYNESTRKRKSIKSSDLCHSCQTYLSYCNSCRKPSNGKSSYHSDALNNLSESNSSYASDTIPKFKITVPQPFSLTSDNLKRKEAKEIKIAKLKEELLKEEVKELNVKIRSKPVPKHVKLPMYEEMARQSENRKKERRGKCQEILEKETKPFNLSYTTKITKSKSVCDIPKATGQFKAKPVPKNILSENVSKRIQDKEKLRKILISHRAEETLKQSSLPFSQKPIQRSFSLSNLGLEKDRSVKISRQNVDAITKRLYTIKCKETMDDWNNKVMLSKKIENKQTIDYRSKFNENFPFCNFPVRMSTAALLRDKQIREELSSRKRRDKQEELIQETIARKKKDFLKSVWPRLKSVEPIVNSQKEIEDKVKSFKESQKIRKREYEKEIEEMMQRVSKQYLLIERQSKDINDNQEKIDDQSNDVSEKSVTGKESEKYLSVEDESEKHSTHEEASEKYSFNEDDSEKCSSNEEASENDPSNKEVSGNLTTNQQDAENEDSNQNLTEQSEDLNLSSACEKSDN